MQTFVLVITALSAVAAKPRRPSDQGETKQPSPLQEPSVAPFRRNPPFGDKGDFLAKQSFSSRPLQEVRPAPSALQGPAAPYGDHRDTFAILDCGEHALEEGSYTIQSPNHPDDYENNYDCAFSISPGTGVDLLAITCSAFDLEYSSSCNYDWLQLNGTKFCGTQGPSLSLSGAMAIDFHTDSSVVATGFSCVITAESSELTCGSHVLNQGTYTIQSPNHPDDYENDYDCAYNLTPGTGVDSLGITCSAFDLESSSSCLWDWLRVNGSKFCGTQGPTLSLSGVVSIDFHTDASVVATGFSCVITAESSELTCGSHVLDEGNYTILSPNHPEDYENNYDCVYNLSPGTSVESLAITCSAFDLEYSSSCNYDWLQVNGTKFCGTEGPSYTVSQTFEIYFRTDVSIVDTGFLCTIEAQPSSSVGCNCGEVQRTTRVVGGMETEVNEYRWQAGLVRPGSNRTFCGGVLINDKYVLTAGHCTVRRAAADIQVLLGDHQIDIPDGETRHAVIQIILHPLYSSRYDFSLLELQEPVTFDTRRAPVCLPTADQTYAGATAIATGFGRTGASEPQATELQEVEVIVRSQAECQAVWEPKGTNITSSMICAGGRPEGGEAVCFGDSGGPLITLEDDAYAVIGVVSFGEPCAVPNVPDVYARVTEVLAWIQNNSVGATWCY